MRFQKTTTLVFTCLLIAPSVFAGPGSDLKRALNSAPLGTDSLDTRQNIEIAAGTDKEQVSIEVGQPIGDFTWSAKLSAPIDKEKKQGELANLDGLADSIRISGTIKLFRGQPTFGEDQFALFTLADNACKKAARLTGKAQPETYIEDKCNDNTGLFSLDDNEIQDMGLSGAQASQTRNQLLALEEEYDCLLWSAQPGGNCKKTFRVYALTASVGSEEFKFFDTASTMSQDQDKTVASLELSATFLRIPSSAFLRLSYRRERAYDAAPDQLFCQPTPIGMVLTCQNLAAGPPVKKDNDILSVEMRKWVILERATASSLSFGVSPKLSYNLEDDVLGINVPFYFIPDAKGNLTGGLNLGWRDDTRDISVGVFIGSTFRIF